MSVIIRKAETPADHEEFFRFPWKLYRDDPNWVPPLPSIRRDKLDRKKNPAWEYMEGDYYLAIRGDETVGTIAIFVNHHHNMYHNENIAMFGFFETINDQEVADALLHTAWQWAYDNDYEAVRGPQSFTNGDEYGLLVENFSPAVILMAYNPPYYQQLIENAGFSKVIDIVSLHSQWQSLEKDDQGRNVRQRLDKLLDRIQRNNRITTRPIDRRSLQSEFKLFAEIYNDAWAKNWGFTPITQRELEALIRELGPIFDPNAACFAYVNDQPAGFIIGVPDLNQAIHKAYPTPNRPELLNLAQVGWHWKIRPVIDTIRVPLMGVKEEFRHSGADLVMYDYLLKAIADSRYVHMDSGWVLETNSAMLGVGKSLGMKPYKTYRFYEKATS